MDDKNYTLGQEQEQQYNEAYELLKERWEKNNLDYSLIEDTTILCLGDKTPRYPLALLRMGADSVLCVSEDVSVLRWPASIPLLHGLLNQLPLEDSVSNFVFCNGVLSHTYQWTSILEEISRILKPGGYLWLSVYGEGPHWSYCDAIREKLTLSDRDNFKTALILRNWPENKINFLVELFFSECRIYFTRDQILDTLKSLGYNSFQLLERGVETDLNEQMFNDPQKSKLYGEGEIRLIARKR